MKKSNHSLLKGLALAAMAHPLLTTNMFAAGESLIASADPAAMTTSKALQWLFFGVVASIVYLFALVSKKLQLGNQAMAGVSRNLNIALTELDGETHLALHGLKREQAENKPEHAARRSGNAALADRAVEYNVEYAADGRPIVQTVAPAAVNRPVEYSVEYELTGRPVVHSVDAASNGSAVGRVSGSAEGGAVGRISRRAKQTAIQAFIEKSVEQVIAESV